MAWEPNCMATAVGSMPHVDPGAAVDLVLRTIPEAPIWPQLPARGLAEQMEVQYSEGMPCRVVDRANGRMYFDTSGDYSDALARFYEVYIAAMDGEEGTGDCSAMAISPDYAAGLYELEGRLRAAGSKRPFVKVHTTGPCSFALTAVNESKRALFYHEEFRDVVTKALAMKCRWQIQKFRPYADRVICFVDEPILAGFGSSTYVAVQRDDVVAMLKEMVDAVHADGALAGVHCCGNTEWSIPVDAGVDVVNFDAYQYGQTVAMYPDHMRRHLEAGGVLAWGLVPTSPAVRDETVQSLASRYERLVDHLAEKTRLDRRRIVRQTVLTGSCGTGSMQVADAERVFELTGNLSAALRDAHGL